MTPDPVEMTNSARRSTVCASKNWLLKKEKDDASKGSAREAARAWPARKPFDSTTRWQDREGVAALDRRPEDQLQSSDHRASRRPCASDLEKASNSVGAIPGIEQRLAAAELAAAGPRMVNDRSPTRTSPRSSQPSNRASRSTGSAATKLYRPRSPARQGADGRRIRALGAATPVAHPAHIPTPTARRIVSCSRPTGVGEAGLAKALARSLFDDKALSAHRRVDPARVSVSRLVVGLRYVGWASRPSSRTVRRPPLVVLLDEVEKGACRRSSTCCSRCSMTPPHRRQGRTVDFRDTITFSRGTSARSPWSTPRPAVDEQQDAHAEGVHPASSPFIAARLDDVVDLLAAGRRPRPDLQLYVDRLERRPRGDAPATRGHPGRPGVACRARLRPDVGAQPLRRLMQRRIDDELAPALLLGACGDRGTMHEGLRQCRRWRVATQS